MEAFAQSEGFHCLTEKPLLLNTQCIRNAHKIKVEFVRDELAAYTSQILGAIWVIMPKSWR